MGRGWFGWFGWPCEALFFNLNIFLFVCVFLFQSNRGFLDQVFLLYTYPGMAVCIGSLFYIWREVVKMDHGMKWGNFPRADII